MLWHRPASFFLGNDLRRGFGRPVRASEGKAVNEGIGLCYYALDSQQPGALTAPRPDEETITTRLAVPKTALCKGDPTPWGRFEVLRLLSP